ncbi:MAG TPA: hypothetical protein VFG89_08465 [Coriobacteriia bacterium]|nr:hypothetical protein [Coriobacteriia bacterium]
MQTRETRALTAAQREAETVLARARDDAERILLEAHEQAVALLLRQQDQAARLLLKQEDDARVDDLQVKDQAADLPAAERGARLANHREDADALLERQRLAAEILVSAQTQAATELRESLQHVAADVLLRSHKEAAAILLEARIRVIEGWSGNERPAADLP